MKTYKFLKVLALVTAFALPTAPAFATGEENSGTTTTTTASTGQSVPCNGVFNGQAGTAGAGGSGTSGGGTVSGTAQ